MCSFSVRLPRHRDLSMLLHNGSINPLCRSLRIPAVAEFGQMLQNQNLSPRTVQILLDSRGQGIKKKVKVCLGKVVYVELYTLWKSISDRWNYCHPVFKLSASKWWVIFCVKSHKAMLLQTLPFLGTCDVKIVHLLVGLWRLYILKEGQNPVICSLGMYLMYWNIYPLSFHWI